MVAFCLSYPKRIIATAAVVGLNDPPLCYGIYLYISFMLFDSSVITVVVISLFSWCSIFLILCNTKLNKLK